MFVFCLHRIMSIKVMIRRRWMRKIKIMKKMMMKNMKTKMMEKKRNELF